MQLGIRFLARRDRTVAQVERFLVSKGASPVQVRQTVRRLSNLNYLNDHAYAQRWVVNRLTNRPRGRERLKAELQAKGISETLADRVIADAFRGLDEEAVAHRVLQTAQRYGRRLTRSQTSNFLRRRGFSEETIDRMIEKKGINEEAVYEE
ncbi:MAG: regulatory protein RecX [Nitrospira sp.]|nr:regulatory protein RecX [Nitrospira sp.]